MTKENFIELLKDLYWDIADISDEDSLKAVLKRLNHDIEQLEESEPLRSHCNDK
ncbi:hypothetical protein [Paenibacillus sp. Soil724D2]|uniref:hypothetical protein n=1 Tax=Paenibacillus sp. (strain Soil724D2) TaxID=1736392 RepID=UPI000AFB990F|nr:hypothetical protein [Paenibacillus sp. Soil724D2]